MKYILLNSTTVPLTYDTFKCSVLSLNVKGLRNTVKRHKIINWLKDHNCLNSITFLQETHSDVNLGLGNISLNLLKSV